jgi:hypothetical protein
MNTNPIIVPVVNVIAVGIATTLTMGGDTAGTEVLLRPQYA